MDAFISAIYTDPMLSLGYLFAFLAACATVLFFRGFFAGFIPLFTLEPNAEYMDKHRARATWGVLSLFALFTLWEILRALAAWITQSAGPSYGVLETLAVLWLVLYVLYWWFIK